MELSLVCILDEKTKVKTYHAVNDYHYDGMLAGEIQGLSWSWLGQVYITEEILNEEGFYYGREED